MLIAMILWKINNCQSDTFPLPFTNVITFIKLTYDWIKVYKATFSHVWIKLALQEINFANINCIKNLLLYITNSDWINAAPLKSVRWWLMIFVSDYL